MEEQNHIADHQNSHHDSASETTKTSSSHHSPTKTKHNDGLVKNHHPKPKEHSGTPKHKDGTLVKHKDGVVRSKDPHHKHKDPSLKPKSSSQKPNDHNSKPRDHKDPNAKPRDPSVKSSDPNKVRDPNRPKDSSKHKDPNVKSKDPSIKHKDPSLKPKDPSLKPKDPSLKPKDQSLKHKDSSSKPKDPSLKPKDPSIKPKDPSSKDPNAKPKDPSLKHKDPTSKSKDSSAKPSDPNSKPKDPTLKPKDPSVKPKDPSLKHKDQKIKPKDPKDLNSKLHSPRPSDSSKPRSKDPNRKENHEHRKDGTIKKSSSSSDPNRHSSSTKTPGKDSKPVKSEKRPGEVSRDGHSTKQHGSPKKVFKQEGEQITVKTEKPEKVKGENDSAKAVKTPSPVKAVKEEPESDEEDEKPLNQRLEEKVKRPLSESEDDEPLTARIEKVKKKRKSGSDDEFVEEKPRKRKKELEDEDYDDTPQPKKKKKKDDSKKKKKKKDSESSKDTKPAKKKKKEEEIEVWKWWEEEPLPEGVRWRFLEHKGPVFAPPYEPLPTKVKFYYDGKHVVLSEEAEEVAGFYARMLDHDYTTKEIFNKNFFRDWRKTMNEEEQALITDLKKCDFTRMHKYFLEQAEIRKNRTKEEKQALKEANEKITEEYGYCNIDGHKEKIGNFKIEPPGLFRGRGDHPKMGMLKKRIQPEQITINCSKDSVVPKAPEGHRWKAVTHDDSVTWLVSWTENIQGSNKYIMLNPSSRLKGEKDWMKYETARKLKKSVDRIRDDYRADWKSKEMRIRQRAVALYFIDKLALRAGNEKEEGETADTVGCCSLRVEHIKLHEQDNDQEFVVEFDFLGKDSIRYTNKVAVEKRVFKNLQLFIENKQGDDDLFDRLNTSILNKYLQDLMPGLTAKVFRTYNASITLQNQLKALTVPEDSIPSKILAYNRANRAVAVLCNHQRAAPKTFDKQMANLKEKVKAKMTAIKEARKDLKSVKQEYKKSGNDKMKQLVERKKKAVDRLEEQLSKLEMQATDKEENKEIALGTSKLNYLDPRISVAWCKKWEVPMEKVYNRTQRDKFRWAIDMADEDYVF